MIEIRFRSADRSSLNLSGDSTMKKFTSDIIADSGFKEKEEGDEEIEMFISNAISYLIISRYWIRLPLGSCRRVFFSLSFH